MPIAEPSSEGGLWPKVRAITGWIESDEETMRLVAGDWRGAGGHFAAAGGHPVDQFATLWSDGVGADYLDRTRGNLATAAASADIMVALGAKADRFAGLVNQLVDESANRVATQNGGNAPIEEPPKPGDPPAAFAEYWKGLSEEERQRLAREQPEWVGSQDGFAAEHRDIANRILMAREKVALTAEYARLAGESGTPYSDYPLHADRLQESENELHGIEVIEGRLGGDYYLMGFDTMGAGEDARAIVAHGNPDSAVITWLGYDAPDSAVVHAVSPAYAIEAKESLDNGGLPVNDILAVGSPGMAVVTADELNADRVWVLEANRDDAHLNYFYERPDSIPDGQTNPSYYNIGDVIAGRDPSHP